ncbi:MAG: zinc metalloprotease HtpX [Desulfosarcinaceae bacterium]|nr:zinc metalloprotease HtpX [Desulfosarcinaceae bacterium]
MNHERLNQYRQTANLHSLLLVAALAGLLAVVGYLLGGMPIALTAALGVGLLYLLNPRMAPWLLLKSFRAYPLRRGEAAWLDQAVDTLTARAGLPHRPRLFLLPHDAPTAFTMGEGASAVVALSQGLLRLLSPREVTGVLAHELSHIRHQDTHLMGFAHTLAQMTGILSSVGQMLLLISLPLLLTTGRGVNLLALALLILAPQLSGLLHLALSRAREYSADMRAAELLGSPGPLADALHRLDRYARHMRHNFPWFLSPRREPVSWLSTHPPTAERIRRLLQTAPRDPWQGAVVRWRKSY